MNIEIKCLAEPAACSGTKTPASDDGFKQAVESACSSVYFNKETFVAISPRFEQKMLHDPDLARDFTRKIEDMTRSFGSGDKDRMVIVDRSGEITQYSTKARKDKELREAEDAKEAAKARLRKRARLEAYFKIVRQAAIKRKLIEEENIRRPRGKRYRSGGTRLDSIAKSILQQPNRTYPFYF